MKDSDTPELNYAWWKKNQPTTLPKTGLGQALRAFEEARAKALPTEEVTAIPDRVDLYADAIDKLHAIGPAVATAMAKCNKTLHGTCLKVLAKYPNVIVKEDQALKKQRDHMTGLMGEAIQTCKTDCAKVISDIIGLIKPLETKLAELEKLEVEANEVREEVAKAVASKEPNAGELEVSIINGHLTDARKLARDITSGAERSSQQVQQAWARAFNKKLTKFDGQIQRLADRADQQAENFGAAAKNADTMLRAVESAAKAVKQLADGQGDLEEQFLQVCLTLEDRTQKVMGGIRASFANAGGEFDRVNFNIMNFKEKGDKKLVEEAVTALKRGIASLNAGKKELTQNKSGFDKTLNALPDFATPRNPKFKDVLVALGKARDIYQGYESELKELSKKAEKAATNYQATL
jgi:hypothetical protein